MSLDGRFDFARSSAEDSTLLPRPSRFFARDADEESDTRGFRTRDALFAASVIEPPQNIAAQQKNTKDLDTIISLLNRRVHSEPTSSGLSKFWL
jgi:hypothetical protein